MNNPRNLAMIAAGVGAAVYFIPGNVFSTPGTKNIGDAWSRGGGSTTHTPAISTPRGYAEKTESNQLNPKGIDTQHFKDNHASQRTDDTTNAGKEMNRSLHGTDHNK
ncbi:hypothetical protein EJ08DRAFT_679634 [Tothia fuscella]|uniref:Uncharacterized protein n=1 Tax=Tothia fuscella TaxID=1048955 RepID=A0A9P4NR30_9PEZI|nr:hypothetical protein EJ08DRAFT_679634 [Tothia fuscella]